MVWYEEAMQEYQKNYREGHREYYAAPSSQAVSPFRIADGLYYVGDRKVCVHLLETDEGLILLDAGFPCAIHLLIENIWRLGFDPKNVRWILLTHGHSDHFGAANEFRSLYGTRVAISAADAASLREDPRRGGAALPVIDRELQDGEIFSFGGRNIRCLLTPGHTLGVMSFFFDVTAGGKTYRAGLFGGAGHNALTLHYMLHYGLPLDMPQRMLSSIDRILDEPVEIHLGNHPENNRTMQKRERQLQNGGNPFIDPDSWKGQLLPLREATLRRIEENRQEAAKHGL